jgi:hypothetical protein
MRLPGGRLRREAALDPGLERVSVGKFLKTVGVTAQREIELAVRARSPERLRDRPLAMGYKGLAQGKDAHRDGDCHVEPPRSAPCARGQGARAPDDGDTAERRVGRRRPEL